MSLLRYGWVLGLLGGSSLVAGCGDDAGPGASGGSGGSTTGGAAEGGAEQGGNGGSGEGGNGGSGEGGNGGSGEGGATAWDEYCATRDAACDLDIAECQAQEGCARALLRDEIEEDLLTCSATTCDDSCFDMILTDHPPSAEGEAYFTECSAFVETCTDAGDDLCTLQFILPDDVLGEIAACFDSKTCDEAAACVETYYDELESCEGWL